MARSYSDNNYGGHQNVSLTKDIGLTTNAALTAVDSYTFMYPAKVLDAQITFLDAVAGDIGTSTVWTLAKSTDNATGNVVFATLGVADPLTTATYAAGEVLAITLDGTAANQTFTSGDQVLFQIEGTVGEIVSDVRVDLEIQEVYEQADS